VYLGFTRLSIPKVLQHCLASTRIGIPLNFKETIIVASMVKTQVPSFAPRVALVLLPRGRSFIHSEDTYWIL